MNFNEAMDFIGGSKYLGSRLGLDNTKKLLELLGNPQDKTKFVHIAGTNGKGSVSAFISNILICGGMKTGVYTSPHLESFNERITINNKRISDDEIGEICELVRDKVLLMIEQTGARPTEFEIITAMAFLYFSMNYCDIVILEVGLGGRLDTTNVIDTPLAAVITAIDYDHTKELGATLSEITFEKAGIIKPNGNVVSYKQLPEAESRLIEICAERHAELYITDFDAISFDDGASKNTNEQIFNFGKYKNLKIKLLGEHQMKNAAVAITAAEVLKKQGISVTEEAIRNGVYNAEWSGRFEILRENPTIVIDGAHNLQGAKALAEALRRHFEDKKVLFVIGVLKDKDYGEMVNAVLPYASRFYTVTPPSERALEAAELSEIIKGKNGRAYEYGSIEAALKDAVSNVSENEIICCFGSLYYIGIARGILMAQKTSDEQPE